MSKRDISQKELYLLEDTILDMIPEKAMQQIQERFCSLTKVQLEQLSRDAVISAVVLADLAGTSVTHILGELIDIYQRAREAKQQMVAAFFHEEVEAFIDGMLDADKPDT